jgi:dipeptidyl aminopeptidase/acylaminoacyl peptidase
MKSLRLPLPTGYWYGLALLSLTLTLTLTASVATAEPPATLSQRYKSVDRFPVSRSTLISGDQDDLRWIGDAELGCKVEIEPSVFQFQRIDAVTGAVLVIANEAELVALARQQAIEADSATAPNQPKPNQPTKPASTISSYSWPAESRTLLFQYAGKTWSFDPESQTLTSSKDALPAPTSLLSTSRRSQSGSAQISLSFENGLDESIQLWWLDSNGRRVRYGSASPQSNSVQNTYANHLWLITDDAGEPLCKILAPSVSMTVVIDPVLLDAYTELEDERRENRASMRRRPERFQARIQNENLIVIDTAAENDSDENDSPNIVVQSDDGDSENFYSGPFRWSPDNRYLLCFRNQPGDNRRVQIIDSSPDDQVQPKLVDYAYDKPGDKLLTRTPVVVDVENQSIAVIESDLFANAFHLRDFRWRSNSQSISFIFNARGHQTVRLLSIDLDPTDVRQSVVRTVIDETSLTFVDYANKYFLDISPDESQAIWMSERDGWCHLYRFNADSGSLFNQITRGEWVVRDVERVDYEQQQIWFTAGGLQSGEDPYHRHLCRIDFDGSNLVDLTPADGDHRWQFSPDRNYLIDTYSRVDQPETRELRSSADGHLIATINTHGISELLKTGWQVPERFVSKGRDGETDIYGYIVRPRNFDSSAKYPIIEAIYAGPHSAHVPKSFSLQESFVRLADLGFIVVKIDGMGTSHRSKSFHDVCWKNLADGGFPDRRLWITAAANQHPEMDLSRVGIYGGSAGGQNALAALLHHGDFYHAAFADCGCHDNRMDKIWWNELWMGYPIGPHYAENSNVTHANKLMGRLMLCVGELDRNVDPSSTYQVVDALVAAEKEFDFLLMPGYGHGAGGSRYGRHRMYRFFEDSFFTDN